LARLTDFISRFALGLGGLGIALVAVLDSSFIPLPGVVDGCIVFLASQQAGRWPYYAAMGTGGSMLGCYVLYALARKGGHAFLERRFKERHVTAGLETFRRYGLLAIVVPSILPPPAPFKLFVLLAGVTEISAKSFLLAVFIGRGFRYTALAYLAYRFGPDASRYISANLARVSIWLAVAVGVGGLAWVLWRRRRRDVE
jgi:membrane protein YqaA with SNARE-associated domain